MPHNKLGSEKQQNGVCWKTLTIEPNENESNHYRQPVKKLPLGYSKKLSSGDSNILRPRNDLNVPPTHRKQYVDSCSPDEYDRIYDHGDNRNFPTRSYRTNATNSSIISQKKSHPDRYFLNTGPLYVRTVSKAPPKYESKSLYQKKRIHRIPTGGPTLDAIYALSKLQQQKDKNTENEITENASSFPSSPRIRRAYIKRLWRKAFIYACSVAAMSVKPPKQETRYSLKRLEKSAIDTTRRKIFVAWESILSTLEADYSYKEDEKIPVHCWIKVLVNIANVSDVEIMKLFGYIIGPTLKVNIPEKDVEEICHAVLKQSKEVNCLEDYYFSSKSHILIAIDQFKMCVQPTVYEVKEWHHASHFERLLGDEDTKMDLKLKQDYETQMKMKRETAQEKLKEAWVQSLDESLNGKISLTILNRREAEKKMKRFSTPVLKAGWGESFSAEHKKSLYYIMVSGTYGPEVPTSIVWHEVEKKYDAARMSCGSMYHIPINQARLSMMNCVAYGRGLGGLLPKEAVEIFLEYLAMRCQAVFRGLKKRKRMYRAMKMWKERDFMLQKRVFSSWRCFVLKYLQFHTNCRWTFSRWKRRNRLNRNKKLYFQTVFWPWFTWKRSASVARFKRNKLNRMCNLWRACLLSRVLNTWNHLTRKRIETSEAMDRYKYMKNIKTKNIIFSAWKRFHQTTRGMLTQELCPCIIVDKFFFNSYSICVVNIALRHAWNRQGNLLMQNTQLEKLYIMFNCWRYFSYCSTLTKKRVRKYCLTYVEERRNAESRLNIPKSMPRRKPKDDQNKQEKRRRKTFRTKNSTSIQKTNRGKSICKQNNVVKIEHVPTFPMVQHLTWGCYLSRDIEKCCFLIHQHFKRKEHINMIAAHFILKRTRPLVLRYLHEYTCEQKKAKDVIHYFERIYLKKFFVGLKKYVKVQRKQRQNTESYNFEYDSDDSSISLRSIRSDSPYFSETKLEIDSSVRILELENNVRSIQLERFQDRVNRLKAYTLCYHKNENKNDQVPFPFLHETRQHGSALDEKDMLASEREKTLQAAHRALEYVNNIAVNAAHNLTNVLEGVFLSHEFNIKRRYFRSLRLPIMIKKVDKMFIKKKLSNFIRLCKNFVLLQNNIHRYRERTLQKSCFECWFVFLYKVNITRSCGILLFCKTEKRHVSAFDTYLEQQGMVPGFKSYELMNPLTSTIKAVFSRWVSYTAKKKIGERIIYSFRKKSQLKLLLRVFRGIKQNEPTDADSSSCFLLRRYSLDLDLMFKYTITSQRNTLSSMIRHQNYERKRAIIEGARSGPSFKKFLSEHTNLVQRRINAEQIMLEKSFKLRNCLEYNDQRITNPIAAGNNIVEAPPPCSSESVDDSAARNIHRSWNDQPPPVGFHLSEIWINVKPGQGIVGKS